MSDAMNVAGLTGQHVELLPARLVMSAIGVIGRGSHSESTGVGGSGGAGGKTAGGNLWSWVLGGSGTDGPGGAGGTGQGDLTPLSI